MLLQNFNCQLLRFSLFLHRNLNEQLAEFLFPVFYGKIDLMHVVARWSGHVRRFFKEPNAINVLKQVAPVAPLAIVRIPKVLPFRQF